MKLAPAAEAGNGLDGLVERTTIKFPRPIMAREVFQLLGYVSKEMRCAVNYLRIINGRIGNGFHLARVNGTHKKRTIDVSGSISRYGEKGLFGQSEFTCERVDGGFIAIRFLTTPDSELDDYEGAEVRLWDDTRLATEMYFSAKHP